MIRNKQIGWMIQFIGTTPKLKLTLKCGTTSVQSLQLKLPAVTHTYIHGHSVIWSRPILVHTRYFHSSIRCSYGASSFSTFVSIWCQKRHLHIQGNQTLLTFLSVLHCFDFFLLYFLASLHHNTVAALALLHMLDNGRQGYKAWHGDRLAEELASHEVNGKKKKKKL